MKIFAVLLAAGTSTRFGSDDKLMAILPNGLRVWESAFRCLRNHQRVDGVGIVGPASLETEGADFRVDGGTTRCESSLIGVSQAPEGSMVLVHDAARPTASGDLIDRVIDGALECGAAVPAVPVTDTIKEVEGEFVQRTLNRHGLRRAQTPQAAKREVLLSALAANPEAMDEASALEAAGVPVKVVAGDESNLKITTTSDLPNLTYTTTGFGFDIHAFSSDPARPLILGGVRFEGTPGLDGHSDADVVLHALTDALLGTVGGGDIGELFPSDDPANKNADSMIFLRKAKAMVDGARGQIISLDVTLLAEKPKLSGRRQEIRTRISQELGIPERRINIKATTMEGLGAIGRSEGIAAMATATVALPTTSHEE